MRGRVDLIEVSTPDLQGVGTTGVCDVTGEPLRRLKQGWAPFEVSVQPPGWLSERPAA